MLNRILSSSDRYKKLGEKYTFCKYCNYDVNEKLFQNHVKSCKNKIDTCKLCHIEYFREDFAEHWETCLTKLYKRGLYYVKIYEDSLLRDCERLYNKQQHNDNRIDYNSLTNTQIKTITKLSSQKRIYEIIDVCNCAINVSYVHKKVVSSLMRDRG